MDLKLTKKDKVELAKSLNTELMARHVIVSSVLNNTFNERESGKITSEQYDNLLMLIKSTIDEFDNK